MRLPSEVAAIVATVDPDAYTAAAYSTDEVDMSKWERIMAIVSVGEMQATSTVDFKLQSATTSGGSFSDITNASITQLTKAGSDDDKQVILELAAPKLTPGHRYVKGVLTVAAAASDAGVVILGFDPVDGPASDNDLSSVDEIVQVI